MIAAKTLVDIEVRKNSIAAPSSTAPIDTDTTKEIKNKFDLFEDMEGDDAPFNDKELDTLRSVTFTKNVFKLEREYLRLKEVYKSDVKIFKKLLSISKIIKP